MYSCACELSLHHPRPRALDIAFSGPQSGAPGRRSAREPRCFSQRGLGGVVSVAQSALPEVHGSLRAVHISYRWTQAANPALIGFARLCGPALEVYKSYTLNRWRTCPGDVPNACIRAPQTPPRLSRRADPSAGTACPKRWAPTVHRPHRVEFALLTAGLPDPNAARHESRAGTMMSGPGD